MKLVEFKLLTIICEPVLTADILSLTESLGATGFTVTEVKGEGSGEKSSGEIPYLKTKIEIVLEPEMATRLMSLVAESYFKNYSLIVYASDVSVMRPEKFGSVRS